MLIVGVLVCVYVIYPWLNTRVGTTDMEKPTNTSSFSVEISKDVCMKLIMSYAQNNGYKIDDFNEIQGVIILSEPVSLNNYGYIYQIYITNSSNTTANVEIGTTSKTQAPSRILNTAQNRIITNIKSILYLPTQNSINSDNNSSSKFCVNCGNAFNPSSEMKFCANCGAKI